jgi:hypothetical protein
MSKGRILGCLSVLLSACAAQSSTSPPVNEGPDAMAEPGPGTTTPDARPAVTPEADASPAVTPPLSADAAPATSPDATGTTSDDAAPAVPPPDTESRTYSCTRIIGINATSEWYTQGFETMVDNGKWEIVRVHSGFVELWAQPGASVWSTGASSACAGGAKPDRIIFIGLNFDTTTLEQWLPPLTAVVKNIKDKFPGIKNIELGTFVRAPGNKPCPQAPAKRSTIAPAEDQAIAMVAAANPGLVTISPKFEAKTCNEFSGNPPHPSSSGGAAWAKMMAEHYGPSTAK